MQRFGYAAQKLIDFYTQKVIPSFAARGVDVWNKDVQSRVDAITADKEIGGDNLAKTTETVNRVANTFLSAEESEELKSYSARFGDCPAFLKILTRVGAAMREDKVIIPGAGGDTGELSLADRLYGKK
ncbi:MAG: hypothetical protein UY85_C0034G0002 [Candidatus Peribacteria bacterium GW2011_GWB1_54_5]|nr:MAG: hypothetical protein UY85_C0034G0002 [Candidatus Peribacteria bacterium GW2011_GWB1_54_5]